MSCRLLLLPFLLLALAPGTGAQEDRNDPRWAPDPRDVPDPQDVKDPRDLRADSLSPSHPEFLSVAQGRRLLDGLYEAGNETALTGIMQAHSWDLTDYIRAELDDYLLLANGPASRSEQGRLAMEAQQEKVVRLAQLADAASGDTRFGAWVAGAMARTPETRARLHEMEALRSQARRHLEAAGSADETLVALTPLRQALDIARSVDDLPNQSTIMRRIADIQLLNDAHEEARLQLRDAIRVGREIRQREAVWGSYETILNSFMAQGEGAQARAVLQEWNATAREIGDAQERARAEKRAVDFATADELEMFFNRAALQDQVRRRLFFR